jgi:hypothetical protein
MNIKNAEIGLGLPFDDISGIGLTKNHSDESASPIINYNTNRNYFQDFVL